MQMINRWVLYTSDGHHVRIWDDFLLGVLTLFLEQVLLVKLDFLLAHDFLLTQDFLLTHDFLLAQDFLDTVLFGEH